MARIIFEVGDVFTFKEGAGVVIAENSTVLVAGVGGRTGFMVSQGTIPADAMPASAENLDFSIQMAIRGAKAAVGLVS